MNDLDPVRNDLETSDALLRAGRYADAVARAAECRARETARGALRPVTDWALASLQAEGYRFLCDYAQALPFAHSEVALAAQVWGPDAVEAALARDSLGKVLAGLGRLDEAATEAAAALQALEGRRDTEGLPYGCVLQTLASIAFSRGRYAEQLEWLLRAEKVLRRHKVHRNYGVLMGNLAVCYEFLDRPAEARDKYQEAVQLVARTDSTHHPEYAAAVANFALIYAEFKLYDRTIPVLELAVRILAQAMGPSHCKTLDMQDVLDRCYAGAAKDRPLWDPESRWRVCGRCDKIIDRHQLVASGTDFLACGDCNNVAYCSKPCVERHWPQHGPVCGKRRPVRPRVSVHATDACAACFSVGAPTWCPCHVVRYCNSECQKSHWKLHKSDCASKAVTKSGI